MISPAARARLVAVTQERGVSHVKALDHAGLTALGLDDVEARTVLAHGFDALFMREGDTAGPVTSASDGSAAAQRAVSEAGGKRAASGLSPMLAVKGTEARQFHPQVAALDRTGATATRTAAASGPPTPAIVQYVSQMLSADFLEVAPPDVKAFTLMAIHDARLGKWKTLRALAALLSPGNPFSGAAWKQAMQDAKVHKGVEVPPLDEHEIAALRAVLEGPVADVIHARAASGTPPPRDLDELATLLGGKELRGHLLELHADEKDVEGAVAVAKSVLGQVHEHFDAVIVDQDLLRAVTKADGKLDVDALAKQPPVVRVLLEDPHTGPQTIAAVSAGASVTAQVLKKTPESVLEELNRFAATLAGGGSTWIEELVRTGRRIQVTPEAVAKKQGQIERAANDLEKLVDKRVGKLADATGISADDKAAIRAILAGPAAERGPALEALAGRLSGPAKNEAERFARLTGNLEAVRATDARAVLDDLASALDAFEAFRPEAVRVTVSGGGAAAEGLQAAITDSSSLTRYGHELLVKTVPHDYANETTEGARKIVYGVATVAVGGVGVHELFGDGVMHAAISMFEDLAADVGEIMSLRDQGVPLRDILSVGRFLGQSLTLGVATTAALNAHTFIEAGAAGAVGAGAVGGLMLGVGSTALTVFTSVYSYNMFRRVAGELGKAGALDIDDTSRLRKQLPLPARSAFDAACKDFGRVPTYAELEKHLPTLEPKDKATLAASYDALVDKYGTDVLVDEAKLGLAAVAKRAGDDALLPDLEAAFMRVRTKHQGVPTGESLAAELAAARPDLSAATLAEVTSAQTDVVKLVTSGVDHEAVMREIVGSLAKQMATSLSQRGLAVSEAAVGQLLEARLAPLLAAKELSPAAIVPVVASCFEDVVAMTAPNAAAARELRTEITAWKDELATHVGALSGDLEDKIRDELKSFARREGLDQTVKNPVRALLMCGVGVAVVSLTAVGALLPAFLVGKAGAFVLATLASSESIVAAFGLSQLKSRHEKQLAHIGEALAAEVRRHQATTA